MQVTTDLFMSYDLCHDFMFLMFDFMYRWVVQLP